jgi:Zn finger protein HypA/HybF involved in hydrogenase expression
METEEFRALLMRSRTLTEALAHFGLSMRGHNYRTLLRRTQEEGIDISHFQARHGKQRVPERALSEILRTGSVCKSKTLKTRLIREGLLIEECSLCSLKPTWNDKPLQLHLDHINGQHLDNRLENLRLLCPNCHSQTDTYAGRKSQTGRLSHKNVVCRSCGQPKPNNGEHRTCARCSQIARRKVDRPDIESIRQQVEKLGYTGTGRIYGVSDNAIRKWLSSKEK